MTVTETAVDGSQTASPPAASTQYVLEVRDRVDDRIAGRSSCTYSSPPLAARDAVALARLLLEGPVGVADGVARWSRTVAVAGGRRTVTLVRSDLEPR